jgi:LysM repeat protein
MEFWIKRGKEELQLPVKPTEFTVNVAHRNTVVNVIQLGDLNLIGKTGLREVSLSSFFPAKAYNFSNNSDLKDPIACVNQLDKWRNSGKPVRVIITDLLNMEATIESFSWGERDATGDIYYTLALKEYRKIKNSTEESQEETITTATTTRETKAPESSSGETYTVKSGDSLWLIAKKFYGDGSKYTKIYNANAELLKNSDVIYAGQVLKIP